MSFPKLIKNLLLKHFEILFSKSLRMKSYFKRLKNEPLNKSENNFILEKRVENFYSFGMRFYSFRIRFTLEGMKSHPE